MNYSEAQPGRVFVIRLEDGDIVHEEIEKFARDKSIAAASLIIVGGADVGSRLIVGPENARKQPHNPMEYTLNHVHEITGTGTIFSDENGDPVVHMHIACGREQNTVTGCIRSGVKVWHVMEVILYELTGTTARRLVDPATGFKLLTP